MNSVLSLLYTTDLVDFTNQSTVWAGISCFLLVVSLVTQTSVNEKAVVSAVA